MTWINILALTLLGLECLSMHFAAEAVLFPSVAFSLGIFCVLFHKHFHLSHIKLLWISAFILSLGVFRFVLLNRNTLSSQIPEYANVFGSYDNAYLAAQILMGFQLLNLSVGIPNIANEQIIRKIPINAATYFFHAVCGQLCIMDRMLDNAQQTIVHLLVLPFALICCLFILAYSPASNGTGRSRFSPTYWIVSVLLLGITGLLANIVSASLHRNQMQLDSFFFSALGGNQQNMIGFSRESTLGSLAITKRMDPDAVALRVIAEDAPGYIRGMVYDRYERNSWRNTLDKQELLPATQYPSGVPFFEGESLFELRPADEPCSTIQEVWPDTATFGILFAPLTTAWIGAKTDSLRTDAANMAELTTMSTMKSHHNYLAPQRVVTPLPEALRTCFLTLPPNLNEEIRELSRKITAGCVSNTQKAAAVTRYFNTQYKYSLQISIPVGNEPLTYFLLNKPAAHCEYFASGAAILLRIAGVPCRYVNGFVVEQRSVFADYWIANNHDAHAWVEAYDESAGWFIVEATPGDGVPTADAALNYSDFWNTLRFRGPGFQQWLARLYALLPMSKRGWITLALAATLCVFALGIWSTLRGLSRHRKSFSPFTAPSATGLKQILSIMDRRVKAKGFVRSPHETINHFSKRLLAAAEHSKLPDRHHLQTQSTWHHEAADWYSRYAMVRYSAAIGETATTQLRDTMPNWKD